MLKSTGSLSSLASRHGRAAQAFKLQFKFTQGLASCHSLSYPARTRAEVSLLVTSS